MKRKHIPLTEKLAMLLGERLGFSYEILKQMTAEEINSRFEWHHTPIKVVDGGPDKHWNIFPMQRDEHKKRTAQIDNPEAARSRRLDKRWSSFLTAVAEGRKPPRRQSKWPNRPMRSKAWRRKA